MSINLDELLKQRAEATGTTGDRVAFEFGDTTFSFKDPLMLTDEEKEEVEDLDGDIELAEWYMGEDEYDRFVATSMTIELEGGGKKTLVGGSSIFLLALREYMLNAREENSAGKSSRQNRSSRRMAERKQRKQR